MTILIVRKGLQGNRGLTGLAAPASITVANNIEAVVATGDNIESVITCADNIDNINTVAADIDNVIAVGESIDNVDIVATNIADINYVADNLADIEAATTAAAAATFYYCTTSGSANAFVLTTGNSITLTTGKAFRFIANHLTDGNVTINVDGTGAKSVLMDGVTQVPKWGFKNGQVITVLYDGTNYQPLHMGPTTGDTILWASPTTKAGWLFLDGITTIAKTSGGTVNGAYLEGLWKHLYDATTNSEAAVSGGRTTRDADWTANKTLTLPETDDMSPYGMGTLLTGAFKSSGATQVTATGTVGTSGSTTLGTSQIPALSYTIQGTGGAGTSGTSTYLGNVSVSPTAGNTANGAVSTNAGGGGHSHTGGSLTMNPASVIHPVFGTKFIIKI